MKSSGSLKAPKDRAAKARWWGSEPQARKAGASAPAFLLHMQRARFACGAEGGGEGQNRTADTAIFSRVLCQLSYLAHGVRQNSNRCHLDTSRLCGLLASKIHGPQWSSQECSSPCQGEGRRFKSGLGRSLEDWRSNYLLGAGRSKRPSRRVYPFGMGGQVRSSSKTLRCSGSTSESKSNAFIMSLAPSSRSVSGASP